MLRARVRAAKVAKESRLHLLDCDAAVLVGTMFGASILEAWGSESKEMHDDASEVSTKHDRRNGHARPMQRSRAQFLARAYAQYTDATPFPMIAVSAYGISGVTMVVSMLPA